MKILGEKIAAVDRKTVGLFFVVLLTTFLLLLLYHKDVWRPLQYWLFLNGCILFIVPLLSLVLIAGTGNRVVRACAGTLIVVVIGSLFLVAQNVWVYTKIKQMNTVLPVSGILVCMTVALLILGKADVRRFGMRAGKLKFWVPLTVIFFVCMVPIIYWASRLPEFQKTYPMLPLAKKGIGGFIVAEISFGIFFVFWEYFFRGYMLFVLEKKTGFLIANLLQAMAFSFMHLGKPELEVYSSLIGGLIIGWLCYRSRSFLPAFFIHWGIQTTMDLFAVIP